jgi:hypothetical protein
MKYLYTRIQMIAGEWQCVPMREKELHDCNVKSSTWTWQPYTVILKIWSELLQLNNMYIPIILCFLLKTIKTSYKLDL